jgi:hypothetical protein
MYGFGGMTVCYAFSTGYPSWFLSPCFGVNLFDHGWGRNQGIILTLRLELLELPKRTKRSQQYPIHSQTFSGTFSVGEFIEQPCDTVKGFPSKRHNYKINLLCALREQTAFSPAPGDGAQKTPINSDESRAGREQPAHPARNGGGAVIAGRLLS